jgi:hypothetical protein
LFASRQKDRAFRLKLEQGWKIKIRAAAGKKIEGTERQCFRVEDVFLASSGSTTKADLCG